MNKLLDVANKKLKELKKETAPTWDTYAQIADLAISIQCLERDVRTGNGELADLIDDIIDGFGAERTVQILRGILVEFKQDLDKIAPHLSAVLIKKIKESL